MKASAHPVPIGFTGKLQNNIAMPYNFTVGSLLSESWKRVKGTKATYWSAIFLYVLIYLALIGIGLIATYFYTGSLNPAFTEVNIISGAARVSAVLITFPLPLGICLIAIRHSINRSIKAKQMFEAYRSYWKILGAMAIIYSVFFFIAFTTLFLIALLSAISVHNEGAAPAWLSHLSILVGIVGGLICMYFLLAWSFSPLLIIEKKLGIFQAIKTSFYAFQQHKLKIIIVAFLMLAIYLISAIPAGIGLIWTLPMLFNCSGILYRIQFGIKESA
ncbi:MAG: hypothetical protein K0S27_821 [Gammaproteobacteria bacterium]|jgi:hypothetical protein|nr:hypothetical protein [Gammaproteobacteria bacterium]